MSGHKDIHDIIGALESNIRGLEAKLAVGSNGTALLEWLLQEREYFEAKPHKMLADVYRFIDTLQHPEASATKPYELSKDNNAHKHNFPSKLSLEEQLIETEKSVATYDNMSREIYLDGHGIVHYQNKHFMEIYRQAAENHRKKATFIRNLLNDYDRRKEMALR